EQVSRVEERSQLVDAVAQLERNQPVDGTEHAEGLPGRELEPQLGPLTKQRAYAPGQRPPPPPGRHPQDRRRSRGWDEDARQHLDRRRLAGSVRTDEREALARSDRQRHLADGDDLVTAALRPAMEHFR